MSRMPSPIEQLKVRIGFTPAVLRQRCAVCAHVRSTNSNPRFHSLTCGRHGLLTTGFSLCNDFSPQKGATAVKDPG